MNGRDRVRPSGAGVAVCARLVVTGAMLALSGPAAVLAAPAGASVARTDAAPVVAQARSGSIGPGLPRAATRPAPRTQLAPRPAASSASAPLASPALTLQGGPRTLPTPPTPPGAADPATLYLESAAGDAALQAARANAQAAGFRIGQAEAAFKPQLSLSGSAGQTVQNVESRGTFEGPSATAALGGRLALLDRGARLDVERARRLSAAADLALATADQDLILRLGNAYFAVLSATDALAAARASREAIGVQLESAQANFDVGTATITDAREARARADLADAQLVGAQNELRSAQLALAQIVGRADAAPRPLRTPVVLPPVEPSTLQAWIDRALALDPAVQQSRMALATAELETERARASTDPTVAATGSLGSTYQRGSIATISGRSTNARVGVELNWPLATGGLADNRIRETLALADVARANVQAAERAATLAVQQAWLATVVAQARTKALEAAEASSRLALEATQLGYQVGVRVNVDVLNALNQLYTAQRDLAQARYAAITARLQLARAAGVLSVEDLQAISPLLEPVPSSPSPPIPATPQP